MQGSDGMRTGRTGATVFCPDELCGDLVLERGDFQSRLQKVPISGKKNMASKNRASLSGLLMRLMTHSTNKHTEAISETSITEHLINTFAILQKKESSKTTNNASEVQCIKSCTYRSRALGNIHINQKEVISLIQ